MYEFQRVAANKQSLGQRKPVYGKGKNDAWYMVYGRDANGKKTECPYYSKWRGMVMRCYSPVFLKRNPTYKGSTVCAEWLVFSKFLIWIERQEKIYRLLFGINILVLQLDKDIRIIGNQEYLDAGCCFATALVNSLLNNSGKTRGEYPQGVCRVGKRYRAELCIEGKIKYLGRFDTPEQASRAYKRAKKSEIIRVAELQQDIRIRDGLLRHAAAILI